MTEIKHNLLTYATSQFDNPNAVIENINSQLIEQIGQKQIQHLKVILPYKNSSHDEKKLPCFSLESTISTLQASPKNPTK